MSAVLLADILDADNLARHVDAGNVNKVAHPTEPLVLYNYTQQCQWSGAWDAETRASRGLIVDLDGNVVARPFAKFHNLSEHGPESAAGPIELRPPLYVFDKLDGSLGIAYRRPSDGHIAWATRGSFTSEQALWATDWWNRNNNHEVFIADGVTLLAEIIYRSNRIVVDYGDREGLALLAVLSNATGEHLQPFNNRTDWWPFHYAQMIAVTDDIASVNANDRTNAEGYVVLSGDRLTRVKLKADEYLRLHKIVTGISSVSVWEMLRHGDNLDAIRDGVPDEFAAWLDGTVLGLRCRFDRITRDALAEFDRIAHLRDDRKAFAAEAVKSEHRALMFAILDGKPVSDFIWHQIKPERETPFKDAAA